MRKLLYIISALCLCHNTAGAQTYNTVTHCSGTRTIAANDVTVTKNGLPDSSYYCGVGPYWIGQSAVNGYGYSFSKPVRSARITLTVLNLNELIGVYINGAFYPVPSGVIGAYPGPCASPNTSSVNTSGYLTYANVTAVPWSSAEVVIDPGYPIDSIRIQHMNGNLVSSGTVYGFEFRDYDTVVNVAQPYVDTLLCVGGSVNLPYTTTPAFLPGNTFSVELSDATGSFASPVTIGSVAGTVSGTIPCTIPTGTIPGTGYRVRIRSTNPFYLSPNNGKNIRISQYPKPNATINSPVCEHDTLKLGVGNLPPMNGIDYVWTGPLMSPVAAQFISRYNITPADAGDYIVKADYYGCIARDTVTLVVKPAPAKPTASSTTPTLCSGNTLVLNGNTTTTGSSYEWIGPGGFSATVASPVINNIGVNGTGSYIVSVKFNGCVSKDTINITVLPTPAPKAGSNMPVCFGHSLALTTQDATPGANYSWTGPGGFTSYAKDTVLQGVGFNASGRYVVQVSATGCTGKDSVDVIVRPSPEVPVASGPAVVCAGDTLQLSCSQNVAGTSYGWTGPGGFSANTQNPSIENVQTSGDGVYTAIADLGGCKEQDTIYIKVKPTPPVPQLQSNAPVWAGSQLTFNIANAVTWANYQWTGPGSFSSTLLNPSIDNVTGAASGKYTVVAEADGCSSEASLDVSVKEATDTGLFVIVPNPNNGNFTIKGYAKVEQTVRIDVHNERGQLVYQEAVDTDHKAFTKTISLNGIPANGVYFVKVRIDGRKLYYRMVVNR